MPDQPRHTTYARDFGPSLGASEEADEAAELAHAASEFCNQGKWREAQAAAMDAEERLRRCRAAMRAAGH